MGEEKRERQRQRQRQRERERIPSRLCAVSAKPHVGFVGLGPTNNEIMS